MAICRFRAPGIFPSSAPSALTSGLSGSFPNSTPSGIEDLVRTTLHEMWNLRMFNRISERFAENYTCFTVPNRIIYGRSDYRTFITSMIAAFPDAGLHVDHICWHDDGTFEIVIHRDR